MGRIKSIFGGLRLFGPLRLKIEPNSITVATSVVGLGNRLIAFASARGLAAEFSIPKVNLIWIADRDVAYCKFSDLFELTSNDTEVVLDREVGYSLLAFYLGVYGKALFNFSGLRYMLLASLRWLGHRLARRSFDRIYHFLDMSMDTRENPWRIVARFRRSTPELSSRTLVYSHELFHRDPRFDFCKPRRHLQKRIDEITDKFVQRTVGVHIRAIDHEGIFLENINEYSPTELFIRKMTDEIEIDDKVKFFLATDSKDVKNDFLRRFPDRIITQESSLELKRLVMDGMAAAVVDLFALARTDKILAPYLSTFSRCAAVIGKTEIEVVLKDPIMNQVYKEDLAPAMRVFEDSPFC